MSNFFHERNIKWMLIVGAGIVFGSSLMLVTKAWPDWTPVLKYFTILAYTAATFLVAEVCRKRLGLQSTARVLHALTLLLLPICFLSLTWLSAGTALQSIATVMTHLAMLIPAIGLLMIAATRITDHWLRGRQRTFVVSYGLLCLAGSIPVISNPMVAFVFITLCWIVFSAGVIKVNRHAFWLAESNLLPRVFGFFPIGMLGFQFVILVGIKAITAIPTQWLGLSIVLTAGTMLLTARTVADVLRQRTGGSIRPFPWPVIVPMFTGLVMVVTGLAVSLSGFSYVGETTYAVIPTAILAAILFGCSARDTRHPGFTWLTLIAITIAYQCSPTLFADLVDTLRNATAQAIDRNRLPLSMYGLTYLPLLGTLAVIYRRLTSQTGSLQLGQSTDSWSKPIKHYVTVASFGLLAVASTDIASLFFVTTSGVVAFAGYAICFRDRRYVIAALACVVVGSGVSIPALNDMGYTNIADAWIPTLVAGLAMMLTTVHPIDRRINRIVSPIKRMKESQGKDVGLCQFTGLVLSAVLALHWLMVTAVDFQAPLDLSLIYQFGFLIAAMFLATLRTPRYLSAASVWGLAGYAIFRWAFGLGIELNLLVEIGSITLIALSIFGYAVIMFVKRSRVGSTFESMRSSLGFDAKATRTVEGIHLNGIPRLAAAFGLPLFDLSVFVLSAAFVCLHVPSVLSIQLGQWHPFTVEFETFGASSLLVTFWMLALAVSQRSRLFAILATMFLPLVLTSILIELGVLTGLQPTIMVWCAAATGITVFSQGLIAVRRDWVESHQDGESLRSVIETISQVGMVWLFALLAISCISFALPMRMVAIAAGLTFIGCFHRMWNRHQYVGLSILANLNALLAVAWLGGCRGWLLPGMEGSFQVTAIPLLFAAVAGSIFYFDRPHRPLRCKAGRRWAVILRMTTIPLVIYALAGSRFDWSIVAIMILGFVLIVAAEIRQAIQRRSEYRVWQACFVVVVASFFLLSQGIISFGVGISQLVLLSLSITALIVAYFARRHSSLAVFHRPMTKIGHALPAVVGTLAMTREFSGMYTSSSVLNSLSLMIAAGLYFHQATVLERRRFFVGGLLLANASLMLLWRALEFQSAVLYLVPMGLSILALVELMKNEIPQAAHGPLRWIGTLTILCSPLLEVLGGSWTHMFMLMLLSVLVILVAIGLRIRTFVYAGSAFLLTDLVAMVIRSTIHNPNLLWACGVMLGIAVIALAAYCEHHRENLLAKIRIVSAELATWN